MTWQILLQQFETYLRLERALLPQSVAAYLQDVNKLWKFFQKEYPSTPPLAVTAQHLHTFLTHLHAVGCSATSQARILSALKSFYKFLLLEQYISEDPTMLLVRPKTRRKLPHTLAVHEVEALLAAIDQVTPTGIRNRAILETLYGTGVRVSELIEIKLSHLYSEEGCLRVMGKGNKERLVPIGSKALQYINLYIKQVRCHIAIQRNFANHLFLNNRGQRMTRHMVFLIVKALAKKIGYKKPISPHTFRHAFATHLIEGGADLRAIQEILGHVSITTTEIYTHLDHSYLKQIIQAFHPRS